MVGGAVTKDTNFVCHELGIYVRRKFFIISSVYLAKLLDELVAAEECEC